MAIVNQEVSSIGIGPERLNKVERFVGYPKTSGTANALSFTFSAASLSSGTAQTTTTGTGSTATTNVTTLQWASTASAQLLGTAAAGVTQPDYARNLVYSLSASANSASLTGGSISVFGIDGFGKNDLFESIALTSLRSSGTFYSGSANFRFITRAVVNASFPSTFGYTSSQISDTDTTALTTSGNTAAPAFTLRVGVGQKLGLPINLLRSGGVGTNSGGVLNVKFNSADQTTTASYSTTSLTPTSTVTLTSIAPLFTAVTGDYRVNGVYLSAWAAASLLEIDYKANGFI